MTDFAGRNEIEPIDFARDTIEENFSDDLAQARHALTASSTGFSSRGPTSRPSGTTSKPSRPPGSSCRGLGRVPGDHRDARGSPASRRSIGGSDGWTLTDWFENIYLRTAGAEKYDQLADHEIPWTDQSVKDALDDMAKVFSDTDNIAGGTRARSRRTSRTRSRRFRRSAQGREGLRGRLRRRRDPGRDAGGGPRPTSTSSTSRRRPEPAVVGGGDMS